MSNTCTIVGAINREPQLRTSGDKTFLSVNVEAQRTGTKAKDYFSISINGRNAQLLDGKLAVGMWVSATGAVGARAYVGKDGTPKASLNLYASDILVLSEKPLEIFSTAETPKAAARPAVTSSFTLGPGGSSVLDEDELPFA